MCRAHPHVGENLRHHYRFQREAADGGELPRPLQPRASRPGDRTPEAHPQRALHWKVVFVYINKTGQVRLKMKSKHVAGTITRKNRNYTPTVGRRGAAPLLQAEDGGAAGHRVRLPQSTGIRTPDERCRTPPPRRRCDKPKLPPLPPSES